jgi:hypothetical protein
MCCGDVESGGRKIETMGLVSGHTGAVVEWFRVWWLPQRSTVTTARDEERGCFCLLGSE